MRILILTSSHLAPTYNERILSQVEYINRFPDMYAELCNDLPLYKIERKIIEDDFDCVYPAVVFHRPEDNDEQFHFNSGLYQILLYHKQDYIGSDLYTQLLLNDKALTSHRSGMGLPGQVITRLLWDNDRTMALQTTENMELPLLIKPNTLSASMGISEDSVAYSREDIARITDLQFQQFPTLSEILIEKYLEQAKEYTVSVTGNEPYVIVCPTALATAEDSHVIYSDKNKRLPVKKRAISYDIVRDYQMADRLSLHARELARKFSLRDYCRFDFLADKDQKLYLIDANTIPALGLNYMHQYTSTGLLGTEQILALLLAVFSRRTGKTISSQLCNDLPNRLLIQLGM